MQQDARARRGDSVLPAPSLPACRRLRHHPRPARRGRADHERARWRSAPSSNGTRTISTRSASSRSTCSALGMLTCIRKRLRVHREALRRDADARRRSRPRSRPSTACSAAPIRSASSRSRAARRCRCCRGSGRRNSTTSSSRSRSCGRARSRATWCIPICAAGRGSRRSPIRRRSSKPCSARRSACRCSRSRR